MNARTARAALAAVAAGLCGAILLDLYLVVTEPFVASGVTPRLVMQWDASNLLGMDAYHGGWFTAAAGTLLHVCVSLVWGALFVVAALRFHRISDHPLIAGVVLGIVAMTVMRGIIHLGHAVVHPFPTWWLFLYILAGHVLFFGIPVAFVATNLLRAKNATRRV
ncbi:MAG TPA: hypothetical protein VKR56_12875 [Candidatus Cybelea sp.]|nr:hypothetical protein [Candidatus Cybelea sp.]